MWAPGGSGLGRARRHPYRPSGAGIRAIGSEGGSTGRADSLCFDRAAVACTLAAGGSPRGSWERWGRPARLPDPPTRFVSDIAVSERVSSEVQATLSDTLVAGSRQRDWRRVARGLSPDFAGRFPRPGAGAEIPDARLDIERYVPTRGAPLDATGLTEAMAAHVAGLVEVERASWHASRFLLRPDHRRAYVEGHFQLAGADARGRRTVVDATLALDVVASPTGPWRVSRLELQDGQRVSSDAPAFRDITDAVGFHFNRSPDNRALRQDVIDTRASLVYFGLSVLDWNRDGFWDLLATEALNQSVLFVNDGRGGLVRTPLPLDRREHSPSMLLFVDLDGDGQEELVGNQVHEYADGKAWIGLHTRRKGRWRYVPRALEFDPRGARLTEIQGFTAGDIDGDGDLDLFLGV